MAQIVKKIILPAKLLFFVNTKKRYKAAYGGRGSSKSHSIARAAIIKVLEKKIRFLCARRVQNSISDSVHKLLKDLIWEYGLQNFFTITDNSIRCYNGSEFIFKGFTRSINEIKSLEGIDYAWVEEAQDVTKEEWDILIPTIRGEDSEIWVSFNPKEYDSDTYQRFVVNKRPDSIVVEINYMDNPFFPEVLRKEMEYCKEISQEDYEHIWLGKPLTISEAQIFNGRYIVDDFDTPEEVRYFHGADWGFAKDPTTLVRCFIQGDTLYIDREAYGVGVELDETPQLFESIETAKKWPIKADCARPETISFMKKRGFNITGAKKWAGSIEDGLAILKSFRKIVIHPRCKHTADEFRLYSYKVDKNSGDILPIIQDKNNHIIDALRYALDGYIKGKGPMVINPSWESKIW